MKESWKKRDWAPSRFPYYAVGKEVKKASNLRVGWMMWWRAILPYFILFTLIMFFGGGILIILSPLVLWFFLGWAGRIVAQKKYNLSLLNKRIITGGPVFFSIPAPALAWGIWWRIIVPLNVIGIIPMFLRDVSYAAESIGWLISIFLEILLVGWGTNKAIQGLKLKEQKESLNKSK
ncbi:MAG: hypothetical protein U9R03_03530 [Candidatus Aerophobetes bacterium]|nr:hypothetical protein [Candidatus Aerophobetes bacterium]